MVKTYTNFHLFIYKLFQNIKNIDKSSHISISTDSKDFLDQIIKIICKKYISDSIQLCGEYNRITLDDQVFITCLRIHLGAIYSRDIINYINNITNKYFENNTKNIKKHTKAGLSIPPSRIKNLFNFYKRTEQQVGEKGYLALSCICEYVCSELISKSIEYVHQENGKILQISHLTMAMQSTSLIHIKPFFKNISVAGFFYN